MLPMCTGKTHTHTLVLPQVLESQIVPVKHAVFIEQPDGYVLRPP